MLPIKELLRYQMAFDFFFFFFTSKWKLAFPQTRWKCHTPNSALGQRQNFLEKHFRGMTRGTTNTYTELLVYRSLHVLELN